MLGIGSTSFRDCRLGGGSRGRRPICEGKGVPMGHCRSRQPEALRLHASQERIAQVCILLFIFFRRRSRLLHPLIASTHLGDLKALTHDVLYETYRTEKLSRTVNHDKQ